MQMMAVTIAMLACLQVKHYFADYLMQPAWMLDAKGDPRRAGGYAHAGVHAFGSLPALLVAGSGPARTVVLVMAEFAAHYLIDFAKARLSRRTRCGPDTRLYWSLHGGDQLMHQFTYAGLILAAA